MSEQQSIHEIEETLTDIAFRIGKMAQHLEQMGYHAEAMALSDQSEKLSQIVLPKEASTGE